MAAAYPCFFSPISLGPVRLRNRSFFPGHGIGQTRDFAPGDESIAYYEARIDGGTDLIFTEIIHVDEAAIHAPSPRLTADAAIPRFARLAEAVHARGAKVFGQLFHPGRLLIRNPDGTRPVAHSASALPDERLMHMPRAMTVADIDRIVDLYADAADRMKRAGFDGMEIIACHGYLLEQFLAPGLNKRTDAYGGAVENRCRFLVRIAEAVRERVGDGHAIGVRLSASHLWDGEFSETDLVEACAHLDRSVRLDFYSITTGSFGSLANSLLNIPPMGHHTDVAVPRAAAVKKVVSKPVLVAGRITQPARIEQIVADGEADMVGTVRAMIADEDFVRKMREGRPEDIRACIGCNQACIGHRNVGAFVSCILNPVTGREQIYRNLPPASSLGNVLVVGGGPGGMKAAAVAASRGHRVTLYEKESALGGQVRLAQSLPDRSEFGGVITNLEREMDRAGVAVHKGVAVDRSMIEREAPDHVIVATGAHPWLPDIMGAEEGAVVQANDVVTGSAHVGGRVLVADWRGDWTGLGVAELLARNGCHVRLARLGYGPGEFLQGYVRADWVGRLHKLGVEMIALARLVGVDGETVYLQHTTNSEPIIIEGIETVVASLGNAPDMTLEQKLYGWAGSVRYVGDCRAPRTAEEAILEGFEAAVKM